MVWKVRSAAVCMALLVLLGATCTTAQAATFQAYEGNPSNTYIQYFKDTLPSIKLGDNYVAFRSGQYQYSMVTGAITLDGTKFTATDSCTLYTIETGSNYNSYYSYSVSTIDSFSLNAGDKIIYSDLGNYPQLEERGARYEILTTILIVAVCVGYVVKSIFHYRPR